MLNVKQKVNNFKTKVLKNLMKILGNNGQEKVDLKLKSIKKENLKLLIITENMKDKLEIL